MNKVDPIKKLCDETGLSPSWVARQLGVSHTALYMWGSRGLNKERARELELLLKRSANKLENFRVPRFLILEPKKR